MNKLKSIFRLSALCLILSAGLFACKSSKKVADASKDTATTEEQQEKPDNVSVNLGEAGTSENAKDKKISEEELSRKLSEYFNAIANSSDNTAQANRNINEAKSMFASPDVPVLIIINESADGLKDYDQPTNILDYMNYLKDQGKNLNEIYKVKTNDKGRIMELELIRK
ncbi:nucleoid-structuring protein H-NS [Marivirga harenae]|uniref:nucleoid-structuring protein H-NS n=1 Tax=Marivirga harenae TaxID=2010992 RepID=UPI0026DFADB2|nr:nucleoid-structuring protein H-NS [Marivirga harenae]WKV11581.1 nucleoid-structuring protein H-NS [Marivirga harenae]|tara:strand:- start:73424 stop:73930 length:507 start_codon:yes stop_codon:yes gene_type:complete